MKVLFWLSKFPAISETFIRDQITGLMDNGVEVFVFPKHGKLNTSQLKALQGFEAYNLEDKVINIDAYFIKNKVQRLLKALTLLIAQSKSSNRKYYYRALNLFKYKEKAWSLRLLFRVHYLLVNNIQIIHAHYGPNGNEAAVFKSLGLPIKLFVTFHGYDIRLGIDKGGAIYKDLFCYTNGVFAISNYNKKHLLDFGLPAHKLIDLPNGIDTEAFKRARPNVLVGNTIRLLSVARLVPEKSLHIAIEAVALVQAQLPDYILEYTLIGEGPERKALEDVVVRLGLSSQVRFLGSQSSKVVQEAMKTHHVFLLSSTVEALPTVLLEAQAAGLIIVATNVGSVEDMVKQRYIATKPNLESFKSALFDAVNDYDLWSRISEKGIFYTKENYNLKKLLNSLIKEYGA